MESISENRKTGKVIKMILFIVIFLSGSNILLGQNQNLNRQFSLGFIENKGQIIDQNNNPNHEVKFLLNTSGLNVQLKTNGFSYDAYVIDRYKKEKRSNDLPDMPEPLDDIVMTFQRIDIEFIGANVSPQLIAENQAADYMNYYTTSTPEEGIRYVRHFGKITYKNLYPNIDLVFEAQTGLGKPVKYNFIVYPGGDISLIQWRYIGSTNIELLKETIFIQTAFGNIKECIPLAWEKESSNTIKISYKNSKNGVFSFTGKYNKEKTLIIDPVPNIKWATYYGGSGNDQTYGVSYDSIGNIYVTGETTSSSNIATSGTQQTTYAGGTVQYNLGGDAMLIKFNSTGNRIWGTYFGGTGEDLGYSIRTNKSGDSYVSGDTKSTSGIATTGAFQTSFAGSYHDVFLAKFNTSGIRQWGTYYGGTGNDRATYNGMVMDDTGNVFITGINNTANNSWITTPGCYQSTNGSTSAYDEPFASKWNPSGKLVWGTYYGGPLHDQAYAIAIDDSGNVYLTGACTSTSGFSTSGAYQTSLAGGTDAFIVKLNNTGTARIWGTYYGGSGNDYGRGITVDQSGNVYISGYTSSTSGFSTSGAYQSSNGGGTYDGFLSKFNASGNRVWGTYYGGGGSDIITTLSYTSGGDLILSGYTDTNSVSAGLTTSGSFQPTYAGGANDALLTKFSSSGTRKWSTFFGGTLQDLIFNHTIDQNGNILVVGRTLSTSGIATSGTHQTSYAGGTMDGFVAKFIDQPILVSSATTIQPDTSATPAGTKNKRIIGVKITTTGSNPFAKITQFSFDTAGIFNYSNITGTAKVYYTGNTDTFNTLKLFDSTSSKPTTAFTISGNQQLDTGTVYFWLTFDVDFNATVNSYLDAKCTQIKWDSGGTILTKTTIISSPVGKIRITPPLKKLNSITFSQPSTYYVYRYSNDNPVLRVDLNVIGTDGTLSLTQLSVVAKNTNNADVSGVKLYFTTTSTFSNSYQIGNTTTISNGIASFSSLNYSLPTGNSYIWITYDIQGSATIFDTVDAKILANGITIGGKTYPATEQNPAGFRIIHTNFLYDAGISAILSPTAPYCKTNQSIKVRLYNYGTTTLTSDTIKWTVNGISQTPYIWNGSLNTGYSVDLNLGNFSFTLGTTYSIKVFPSLINGMYNDSYHSNDTAIVVFTIYPTPVANFSINDSLQCFKGNSFVFTNASTIMSGTYSSYWNFGDGGSSSAISPSHSYQSIDTFSVKLVVTSAYGCPDSIVKNVVLKPNQNTAFSMNDTALCFRGNTFVFTNNTTFNSGTFSSLWKFGDNTTSTSNSPTHSFNAAGSYQIKLITTTNTGCIDSLEKTIYVNPHPITSFQIKKDTFQCFNNNLFEFINTSTINSGTFTNLWNFGDNTSSTSSTPTKSYNTTGNFNIKLITISNYGCKDSITYQVVVLPNPITTFIVNDTSQCNNIDHFIFTNQSTITSGTFTNLWNFGDLSTSNITSPTKSYNTTGTFDVKLLTTSNFGCKDSFSQKVYLRPNANSSFLINDTSQCLKTNSFFFNNTSSISSGNFSNYWYFGDNTTGNANSPTKSFKNSGIFTVKLLTISNYGCKDSITKNIYVRVHPVSSFSINDSTQCLNDNLFKFSNYSSISTGSYTNMWDFGDMNTSSNASPTYIYSSEGSFKVKLITTSDFGCKDTMEKPVDIYSSPFSYFTVGMNPQCLESNLYYLDNHSSTSSGTITNNFWSFGDGDSLDAQSPQHKYKTAGIYTVRLKVLTNFGCSDTSSKTVEIIPQPKAGILINDTAFCIRNHVFQITDDSKTSSGSITDYYWNFGDGKISNQKNTSHSYSASKSYILTHIVTSSNGCTDTITKTLFVYPMPVAAFSINDSIQCEHGNIFNFKNSSTGSGILSYHWSFGDSSISTIQEPLHSYINYGNYTVQLITSTVNNCRDTFSKKITVKESPVVKLGNDTILLHNQSITLNAGSGYDSYIWSDNSTGATLFIDTNKIGLDHKSLFWVKVLKQGCDGSDSIYITFIWNSSVYDLNSGIKIHVFPNPSKDIIYLQSDKIIEGMTFTITDLNGKVLLRDSFNEKSQLLDLQELSNGLYFLTFNAGGTNMVVKVVKSR